VDARSRATDRRRRLPIPALLLLLLAAALAACSGPAASASSSAAALASATPAASATSAATPEPTATPAPSYPLTLTDDEGTEVTIPAEPMKIASLTNAATETLFALGVGDRVVGKVEEFTPDPAYADSLAAIPDVAKFGSVDVEKIVGMDTDLVISGGSNFNPPESIAKLRELGVPVLVVFAPDVETALDDMTLIGDAVGRPDEAATLTDSIRASFDEVADATADLPKPRVYYELDSSSGYFGPAPDYFGTEMITTAGGDALTSGTDGVYQIPEEQILDFDPEVILLGDAAYGVTPEQVAERAGWGTLAAVKSGDVRPIDDVIVTRPGPRLAEGIRALAVAIHPDLVLPSAAPAPSGSSAP
jgi:iron complex transport system substrate-binding protein